MDTALLGLRVVLSLACVLGLIWFAGRKLQGTAGVRKQRSVPLSVLGRQSLGKGAGIALVEVAGRVLLLGVGEQGVRVLTEVDVPAVPDAAPARSAGEVREEIDLATLPLHVPLDLPLDPPLDLPLDFAATLRAVDADAADAVEHGLADERLHRDDTVVPAAHLPAPHTEGTARLAALAGLAAGASATRARSAQVDVQACTASTGVLAGSILSPETWRRAVDVVQRRTFR